MTVPHAEVTITAESDEVLVGSFGRESGYRALYIDLFLMMLLAITVSSYHT
jgi:hypothetical protein